MLMLSYLVSGERIDQVVAAVRHAHPITDADQQQLGWAGWPAPRPLRGQSAAPNARAPLRHRSAPARPSRRCSGEDEIMDPAPEMGCISRSPKAVLRIIQMASWTSTSPSESATSPRSSSVNGNFQPRPTTLSLSPCCCLARTRCAQVVTVCHGPIKTVGQPGQDRIRRPDTGRHVADTSGRQPTDQHCDAARRQNGPPTCGTTTVTIGQVCMSVIRAAGWPPINTVGQPRMMTPPCAVVSPMRAAGCPIAFAPRLPSCSGPNPG